MLQIQFPAKFVKICDLQDWGLFSLGSACSFKEDRSRQAGDFVRYINQGRAYSSQKVFAVMSQLKKGSQKGFTSTFPLRIFCWASYWSILFMCEVKGGRGKVRVCHVNWKLCGRWHLWDWVIQDCLTPPTPTPTPPTHCWATFMARPQKLATFVAGPPKLATLAWP